MARMDLNMHIGRNKKPSKTEAVFFSSRKTISIWLKDHESKKNSFLEWLKCDSWCQKEKEIL